MKIRIKAPKVKSITKKAGSSAAKNVRTMAKSGNFKKR